MVTAKQVENARKNFREALEIKKFTHLFRKQVRQQIQGIFKLANTVDDGLEFLELRRNLGLWTEDELEEVELVIHAASRLIVTSWYYTNPPSKPPLKPAKRAELVVARMAEIGKRAADRGHYPIPPGVVAYRRRQQSQSH